MHDAAHTVMISDIVIDCILSQGWTALRLEKSFEIIYGKYQDLTDLRNARGWSR